MHVHMYMYIFVVTFASVFVACFVRFTVYTRKLARAIVAIVVQPFPCTFTPKRAPDPLGNDGNVSMDPPNGCRFYVMHTHIYICTYSNARRRRVCLCALSVTEWRGT